MQFVNDDMDDVFRKAGEHYPLQVATPDWDKMQQALEAAENKNTRVEFKPSKPLWLLLLALFLLVCTTYLPIHKSIQPAGGNQQSKAESTTHRDAGLLPAQNVITPLAKGISKQPIQGVATTDDKSNIEQKGTITNRTSKRHHKSSPVILSKQQRVAQNTSTVIKEEDVSNTDYKDDFIIASNPLRHTSIALLPPPTYSPLLQQKAPGTMPKSGTALLYKKLQTRPSRFYAGLLGSFDFTTVHLQKANHVGRQLGVIAGYRMGNKWSIETGLYVAKKYYYSEGAYYKPSRNYTPPNTSIVDVDGACAMLEIPLLLKYDFARKRNMELFATAGLSSYLMKKEEYNYLYYYHTTGTYAKHSRSYRNATNNLFSVVHLSGGISRNISRTTAVRVEPYVKLPVAGLGYGKMRFTSAGLNMGVIKKF